MRKVIILSAMAMTICLSSCAGTMYARTYSQDDDQYYLEGSPVWIERQRQREREERERQDQIKQQQERERIEREKQQRREELQDQHR